MAYGEHLAQQRERRICPAVVWESIVQFAEASAMVSQYYKREGLTPQHYHKPAGQILRSAPPRAMVEIMLSRRSALDDRYR
jgi:hypothetical protein